MFKKVMVLAIALFLVLGISTAYSKPLFYRTGQTIEVYLESPSSLSVIKQVSLVEYFTLSNVVGESTVLEKQPFNLREFLSEYGANVKFTETTQSGVSYYAYSPKIKYKKSINGKLINLHVHISASQVKVGSPLIFGSF